MALPADDWQTVYLFVSSTFNDMHAERDCLTKQVFPALRAWCARRRLEFIDVDLRWGITDEESLETFHTLEICLDNVERCRPLFLGLLGQRQGWVPSAQDKAHLPFVASVRGSRDFSITQWELWKGLQNPHSGGVLFLRDRDALDGMPLQGAYAANYLGYTLNPRTGQALPDPAADRAQRTFRETVRHQDRFPVLHYTARWDSALPCPELEGLTLAGRPCPELTRGRLTDFTCQGRPWSEVVLEALQREICRLYPDRQALPALQGLAAELQTQRLHLRRQSAFYVAPSQSLPDLTGEKDPHHFSLAQVTGASGSGKSALLAHLIQTCGASKLYYRFCGISHDSTREEALLYSLARQWFEDGLLRQDPAGPDIQSRFPALMAEASRGFSPLVLVVDGLDELDGGRPTLSWCRPAAYLGRQEIHLVLSARSGTPAAQTLAQRQPLTPVQSFSAPADRRRYLSAALRRSLKQLEPDQLDRLCTAPEGGSPLYLQEVLFELVQHGNRRTLDAKLNSLLPLDAAGVAHRILDRLETDNAYLDLASKAFLSAMLGLLADARYGLTEEDLLSTLPALGLPNAPEALRAALRYYARQLRPFLIWRGERLCFFYTIWREVCTRRYGGRGHRALAMRFFQLCEPQQSNLFAGRDPLAYREFFYHAARTAPGDLPRRLLTTLPLHLPWVYPMLRCCGALALAEAMVLLPEGEQYPDLEAFYRNCQDLLDARPELLPEILATHFAAADQTPGVRPLCRSALDWHKALGLPPQILPRQSGFFLRGEPYWGGSFRLPADTGPLTELRPCGDTLLLVGPSGQEYCPLVHRQTGERLGFLPRSARWWPALQRYLAFDEQQGGLCLYEPGSLRCQLLLEGTRPSLADEDSTFFCFADTTLYCLLDRPHIRTLVTTRFHVLRLEAAPDGTVAVASHQMAALNTFVFRHLRMAAGPAGCALLAILPPGLQLFFWDARAGQLRNPWNLRLPPDRDDPVASARKLAADPLRAPVQGQCDPLGVLLCDTTAWVWCCVPTGLDAALGQAEGTVDSRSSFIYHALFAVSVQDGASRLESGQDTATAAVRAGDKVYAFYNVILPIVTTLEGRRLQAPDYESRVAVYDARTGRKLQPLLRGAPLAQPPRPCGQGWLRSIPGGVEVVTDPAAPDQQVRQRWQAEAWGADDHCLYLVQADGTLSWYDLDRLPDEEPPSLQAIAPLGQGGWLRATVRQGGQTTLARWDGNQWVDRTRYSLPWEESLFRPHLFLAGGLPVFSYAFRKADQPGGKPLLRLKVVGNRRVAGGFQTISRTTVRRGPVPVGTAPDGTLRYAIQSHVLPLEAVAEGPHCLWLVFYLPAHRTTLAPVTADQNTLDGGLDLWAVDAATFEELPAWKETGRQQALQRLRILPGTGLAAAARGDDLYLCLAGPQLRGGAPGTRLYRIRAEDTALLWEQDTGLSRPSLLWEGNRLWLTLPGADGIPEACTLSPGQGGPVLTRQAPLPPDFPRLCAVRRGILLLEEAHQNGLALYDPARRRLLWQLRFDVRVVSASWPAADTLCLQYERAGRQQARLLPLLGSETFWI